MKKFFAPGRVNLIGEHLDYNGGLVLPVSLQMGITLTLQERTDGVISLQSATHPYTKDFFPDENHEFSIGNDWTNYPIGVLQHLKEEGFHTNGCNLHFESTLPESSGLSSSAAIEIVTAFALLQTQNVKVDLVWLANFCRLVENKFIGVQCGIMDQYAISLGKQDHALLIDCASLSHTYIPFELGEYRLLIMNSKKPRSLIHSKYNERKQECEEALRIINASNHSINHLCEAEPFWLESIADEVIRKRARHVISENIRVKEAARYLQMNDLSTFGRLMNVSHQSLKEDYEVSGLELDTLVAAAQQIKNCLGARMTGAGFGGCAIAIVHHSAVTEFKEKVADNYFRLTGLSCEIYETVTGDGVRIIN